MTRRGFLALCLAPWVTRPTADHEDFLSLGGLVYKTRWCLTPAGSLEVRHIPRWAERRLTR